MTKLPAWPVAGHHPLSNPSRSPRPAHPNQATIQLIRAEEACQGLLVFWQHVRLLRVAVRTG